MVGITRPDGRGRIKPILKCLNYYKKTDEYVFKIPFATSRLWSKILLKILWNMPDYPQGRDRATHIIVKS